MWMLLSAEVCSLPFDTFFIAVGPVSTQSACSPGSVSHAVANCNLQ